MPSGKGATMPNNWLAGLVLALAFAVPAVVMLVAARREMRAEEGEIEAQQRVLRDVMLAKGWR